MIIVYVQIRMCAFISGDDMASSASHVEVFHKWKDFQYLLKGSAQILLALFAIIFGLSHQLNNYIFASLNI